jgi:hypothetical protein
MAGSSNPQLRAVRAAQGFGVTQPNRIPTIANAMKTFNNRSRFESVAFMRTLQ